jgi:hypothetical protein
LTKEKVSLVVENFFMVMEMFSLVMEMAPTPLAKSHPVNIFVGLNPYNILQTNGFGKSYLGLLLPSYPFPRQARAQPVGCIPHIYEHKNGLKL